MVATVGSAAGNAVALDRYIGHALAHDQNNPDGPSQRVEFASTIGDCAPETFIADMRRTRATYGKSGLKVETYHWILSHSHEEADPTSERDGWIAHELARTWAAEAFPGRQIKLVTQRDNGRAELTKGGVVWVPGKWHSHIQVASVAEREATIRWIDKSGVEQTKRYPAGRAIDGTMKNLHRVRGVTDAVVERELQYSNRDYMAACRKASRGDQVTRADYAQRADRGYSDHDQVRATLRHAQAQATSWEDYIDRAAAEGVMVRGAGKSGASYAWIGEDGTDQKARARKLGDAYTRRAVEAQCERNVAALARGETLEAPEPVLAPPSPPREGRPVPEFFTTDGKPPWESDKELADYVEQVEREGGTYEGRAREGLNEALADPFSTDADTLAVVAEEHGVEMVDGDNGALVVVVETDGGRAAIPAERLGGAYADRDALEHELEVIQEGIDDGRDQARGAEGAAHGGHVQLRDVRSIDSALIDAAIAERDRESARLRAGRGSEVGREDGGRDGIDLAEQRRRLGEVAAAGARPERSARGDERAVARAGADDGRADQRRDRAQQPRRTLRDQALDRAARPTDRDRGDDGDRGR
ncbi:relaxase/mobilization nuclease domain-containing protein [Gordonia alkaliphila]|uniref:MobA/VirD2-like nuclease domain-containing protein n=1 Tax=Gordonia alkaliphila TaxID=1053547 RepID=A0ABP8Z4L0_9ACTN